MSRHRLVLATMVATFVVVITPMLAQHALSAGDGAPAPAAEGWEYLIVAGGTTNLSPTGNSSMRKVTSGGFRELFVVEKNLDKLGAEGWELVSVVGPPNDPVYYLKRRK